MPRQRTPTRDEAARHRLALALAAASASPEAARVVAARLRLLAAGGYDEEVRQMAARAAAEIERGLVIK